MTTGDVMFSIQKLIGRDQKFYDLLEASAQQADASVHHLIGLLQKLEQHDTPENLEQFAHSRREDKRITQELTEQLSKPLSLLSNGKTSRSWGPRSIKYRKRSKKLASAS